MRKRCPSGDILAVFWFSFSTSLTAAPAVPRYQMMDSMPHSPSIAAVFATMNRVATAVDCIRALASQTRPPSLVVVSDNVSSDDTVSRLEASQICRLS